jgi:hypothetical protein
MFHSTNRVLSDAFSVSEPWSRLLADIQNNQITHVMIDDDVFNQFQCDPLHSEEQAAQQMAVLGRLLAENKSVVRLELRGWQFPNHGFAAIAAALKQNTSIATFKIDIVAAEELPALADALTNNTSLKYLSLYVYGASSNDCIPAIAQAIVNHRRLLSVEVIDHNHILTLDSIHTLKEVPQQNKELMSFVIDYPDRHKEDICQQLHIASTGSSVPAAAPLAIIEDERALQIQRLLAPEIRAQELEIANTQAEQHLAENIRQAEQQRNQQIQDTIAQQTRVQEQAIYEMEQRLAQAEKSMRGMELGFLSKVQAGLPTIKVLQAPAKPIPPKKRRTAFTVEEIVLVRAYLEKVYENSQNEYEKLAIDSVRCPISKEIMADPVWLRQDGVSYDRDELLKMLALGQNAAPRSRAIFSERDLTPNIDAISLLEHFITDAKKAKAEPDKQCRP